MPAVTEKVLVCGDVLGNFDKLFKKVNSVTKQSGPFSALLCVGDFFHPDTDENALKQLKFKPDIPVFVLGPSQNETKKFFSDLRGCELAENIIYLGPSGIYSFSKGLKIAYVSGKESQDPTADLSIKVKDIKSLIDSHDKKSVVDILITSQWPKGITNEVLAPGGASSVKGSGLLSYLAYKLSPRYHFCGSENLFFERQPYRNHKVLQETAKNYTRFISLAAVNNKEKLKWLYAFNIQPGCHLSHQELTQQNQDFASESPFSQELLFKQQERMTIKEEDSKQFFYDMEAGPEVKRKFKGGDDKPRKKHKPAGPCWFCLSSPEVEKHLVISVGTTCYLALAKGGLVPMHLLILPIEHYQSTPDLEEDCLEEINKFKKGLTQLFATMGQFPVFFERNYKTQHLQIQVVPVKTKLVPQLEETFKDTADSMGLELETVPRHSDATHLAQPGMPFFYVELPSKVKLFHRIKKGFPLQFGREVLASPPLLNIPDRIDWRECKLSIEEETNLRDKFREAFKVHDFTLDDSDDE